MQKLWCLKKRPKCPDQYNFSFNVVIIVISPLALKMIKSIYDKNYPKCVFQCTFMSLQSVTVIWDPLANKDELFAEQP